MNSTKVKLLDLNKDSKPTWTPYVDELAKKINTDVYGVRGVKLVAKIAYSLTLKSHMHYGIISFGGNTHCWYDKISCPTKEGSLYTHKS